MYRVKAPPVPRQAGSERKRALVELLAKVEAGGGCTHAFAAVSPCGTSRFSWMTAAFNGSLDAAEALHEAVLPNFLWKINCSNATVYPFNAPDTGSGFYGMADNPARAWLCAIIQALIANEDAKP